MRGKTATTPFGFPKPEDSLGFLLWQTTVTWQRLIKKELEQHGLSHAQFVLLALTLWLEQHEEPPTQIRLIHKSKLDKMTVSQSLKKLAALGWIGRSEDAVDTRAKRVALTAEGKKQLHRIVPVVEKIDADFFSALPKKQQHTLGMLLASLATDP